MLELANFSSLFQFGAAIALAVSVFKSPMEKQMASLEQRLANDVLLIGRETNPRNEAMRDIVSNFRVDLALAVERARSAASVPMRIIAAGAAVNFVLLLWSTWDPHWRISPMWAFGLSVVSVGTYVVGLCWLEFVTAHEITSLKNQYAAERAEAQRA